MAQQDADDWAGFGLTFTEDAVYHEHHYGVFRGRQAILDWLVPVMLAMRVPWALPALWTRAGRTGNQKFKSGRAVRLGDRAGQAPDSCLR